MCLTVLSITRHTAGATVPDLDPDQRPNAELIERLLRPQRPGRRGHGGSCGRPSTTRPLGVNLRGARVRGDVRLLTQRQARGLRPGQRTSSQTRNRVRVLRALCSPPQVENRIEACRFFADGLIVDATSSGRTVALQAAGAAPAGYWALRSKDPRAGVAAQGHFRLASRWRPLSCQASVIISCFAA